MKFPIYTQSNMPMAIKLCFNITGVKSEEDAIHIRMYDPALKRTDYHRRRVPVHDGENCVILKTPIVPDDQLMTEVQKQHGKINIELMDISATPILRIPSNDTEWMQYAEHIAKNCSEMNTGTYSTDGGIKFLLVDSIKNDDGKTSKTPARVYHDNGDTIINVNEFCKHSVFVRMFILMHERGHYLFNTKSEIEADKYAADVLLNNGYPKLEIIYAATKIFPPDSPEMQKRAESLVNHIKQFAA